MYNNFLTVQKDIMKLNNYINLVGSLAMGIALTGCLKEAETFEKNLRDNTPSKMVEFQRIDNQELGSSEADNVAAVAVNSLPDEEEVVVGQVRIASTETPSKPVTVKLVLNNALLPAGYVPLPANAYSFVTPLDAISTTPGSRLAEIRIRLKKSAMDLSQNYALAFEFADAGTGYMVNPWGEAMMVAIAVKNKYDGIYRVTGTMEDLQVPENTGYYPLEWELRTIGPNSVAVYDVDEHAQVHLIMTPNGLSGYGSFGLNLTFDDATNAITSVVNSYGQPSGNGRSAVLNPAGINSWDPATGNIRISYYMLQPGTTIRVRFEETLEYVGPRE